MTVGGHLLDQIMGSVTPYHSPSQEIYSFQLWQSHVVLYIWGFLVNRTFSILLYFLWCFIVSYVLVSSWHVMFFIHTIGHGTFFSIVTVYRFKRVNLLNPEVINGIFSGGYAVPTFGNRCHSLLSSVTRRAASDGNYMS